MDSMIEFPAIIPKLPGIYQIRHIGNGKVYVGSAVNLDRRLKRHRFELNNNEHCSKHLQASWNKYGPNWFLFEVLELVDDKMDLIKREQEWIDRFDSANESKGYNLASTAGSILGVKLSEETKLKIGAKHRGKLVSSATREKLRIANLGKTITAEHRKILSSVNKGNKHTFGLKLSPETIARRVATQKAQKRKLSDEHKNILLMTNLGNRYGLGNRSRTGQKLSPEEISKRTATQKTNRDAKKAAGTYVKIVSEETRARMRLAWTVRRQTPESPETREKKRQAMIRVWSSRKIREGKPNREFDG